MLPRSYSVPSTSSAIRTELSVSQLSQLVAVVLQSARSRFGSRCHGDGPIPPSPLGLSMFQGFLAFSDTLQYRSPSRTRGIAAKSGSQRHRVRSSNMNVSSGKARRLVRVAT